MRKRAIATSILLTVSILAIALDVAKEGYMQFVGIDDIKKLIPQAPPQFAEILKGNVTGCITAPSQTKPVTLEQIRTLRQLTDAESAKTLLGNAYCQTATGFKYLTESGKELTINFDKALDYDFSQNTTTLQRTADPTLQSRPSTQGMARPTESATKR